VPLQLNRGKTKILAKSSTARIPTTGRINAGGARKHREEDWDPWEGSSVACSNGSAGKDTLGFFAAPDPREGSRPRAKTNRMPRRLRWRNCNSWIPTKTRLQMSSVSFKQFFWWRKSLLGGGGRKAPSAEVTNSSRGRRRHENKQEDRGKTENNRELGFVLAACEELLWRERDRWKEEKGMKKRRWVEEEKGQGRGSADTAEMGRGRGRRRRTRKLAKAREWNPAALWASDRVCLVVFLRNGSGNEDVLIRIRIISSFLLKWTTGKWNL